MVASQHETLLMTLVSTVRIGVVGKVRRTSFRYVRRARNGGRCARSITGGECWGYFGWHTKTDAGQW